LQNIEFKEDVSDEEFFLEELENMYDKPLNGFEPLEEKENTKENYENKYISLVLNSFRWYNGLDLG